MADTGERANPQPITFSEDPLRYCQKIYEEAMQRNDDLRETNIENELFYEGVDDKLQARTSDPKVVRSALFIHEVKPAIDTRVSDIIALLEEREFPVQVRSGLSNPTTAQTQNALEVERIVNTQLREVSFLAEGFREFVQAAEIQRSPAAVKVGWENAYEKEAVPIIPTEEDMQNAAMSGGPIPEPRVVFRDKYIGGRPYVESLPPDQFLYEPTATNLERDSDYVCHATWMSWDRLIATAQDRGWDVNAIKRRKEELAQSDEHDPQEKRIGDELQDRREVPLREGYKDNKFLVAEFYICDYDEDGNEVIRQVTTIANKMIAANKRTPYEGIKFPFVTVVANPLRGTIEGMSSIDVTKDMQRLFNEVFNQFLDGVSYRIFPPLKRAPGTQFTKTPVWGPGEIWDIENPEGLEPLVDNPGPLPDLPALMAAVSAKIRDTLNAPDISQGFQAQQYEKATATQFRAQGTQRRAMPIRKRYGDALVKIVKMIIALNQQYHPDGVIFAQPFVVDVPSLTSISDPDSEKQESLLLLTQALQNPIYQTATGRLKIRNLMEDVVLKFKKTQASKYVMTEEELQSDMAAERQLQLAMLNKQAVQEELALTAQPTSQGATQ